MVISSVVLGELMPKVIGIAGLKRVGKDTAANFFVEKGYSKLNLADELKDKCSEWWNIPRAYFDDENKKETKFTRAIVVDSNVAKAIVEYASQFDYYFNKEKLYNSIFQAIYTSPRQMMQHVGSEVFRNNVHPDFWIDRYLDSVYNRDKVVTADIRFENERKLIKKLGGQVLLVKRNLTHTVTDNHVSENSLGDESEYDVIIENNNSVEKMYEQLGVLSNV